MNHSNLHKNAFASCDESHETENRDLVSINDTKGSLVCPKPRRVGNIANYPSRPLRWHMSHQHHAEMCDSKAGAELMDIILMKDVHAMEQSAPHVGSSLPFFCGSPPTRAANPVIQDARFGDEKLAPVMPLLIPPPSSLSSATSCKGGCMRKKFGLKPAAVRVEGFDCLNRDRQNSSIPAMA